MVRTPSTMAQLGTSAPHFRLPDAEGRINALDDFRQAPALLVMFICNHCPFVQHIQSHLAETTRAYGRRGVAIVGINSNDIQAHPDDAPEKMAEQARSVGFDFPYLFDESQEVAKAYGAACTPDFFLYDADRRLVYRGQYDDSRPGNDQPITGADLRAALDALLEGRPMPAEQNPSLGCNIKWKPGNEPDYFHR